jgi:hypothetical protein
MYIIALVVLNWYDTSMPVHQKSHNPKSHKQSEVFSACQERFKKQWSTIGSKDGENNREVYNRRGMQRLSKDL